jgi:hypothetical protein
MCVAVNQAVNGIEGFDDPMLDAEGRSPSVDQPDLVAADLEEAFIGQTLSDLRRIHITVYGLQRFAFKNIKNANISQIAGMQDEITITQVSAKDLSQPLAVTAKMGIRKNTDFQRGRSFKGSEIIYREFKKTSLFWYFTIFPMDVL